MLLLFHNNYGSICTISEIQGDDGWKSQFFMSHLHLTPQGSPRQNIAVTFLTEKQA